MIPPPLLTFTEIARRMGQTRSWFSQRLHGHLVNGKPAQFTESELLQIVHIVREHADEMRRWADEMEESITNNKNQ